MGDGRAWTGARQQGADYFDDIMGNNEAPAAFDSQHGGIRDYEKCVTTLVRAGTTDDLPEGGVAVSMHCRGCNLDVNITIGWDELFVGQAVPHTAEAMRPMNRGPILPQNWAISDVNRTIYPALSCRCGTLCAAHFTPDECGKLLSDGINAGLVSRARVLQYPTVQQVVQVLQQWQQQQQQQQRQGG